MTGHRDRYRDSLRVAVGYSATPYGYTLATWTTGAVITHYRGMPNVLDALLFMSGAVLGFALVAALAFGTVTERAALEPRRDALWGSLHFVSVGLAIGAAALIAALVRSPLTWLLASFASTAVYLLLLGAQLAAAAEKGPEDDA